MSPISKIDLVLSDADRQRARHPAAAAMRASSFSARAGTFASRLPLQRALELGLLDAQAIGVRCDHPELLPGGRHEDPGEHRPRLVPGRRPRHAVDRLHERLGGQGHRDSPATGDGSVGKSSAAACADGTSSAPQISSTSCSALRSSIVSWSAGKGADDIQKQARRQDSDSPGRTTSAVKGTRGRSPCRWPAARRGLRRRRDHDPGQRLDGAAASRRRGPTVCSWLKKVRGGKGKLHLLHSPYRESHM